MYSNLMRPAKTRQEPEHEVDGGGVGDRGDAVPFSHISSLCWVEHQVAQYQEGQSCNWPGLISVEKHPALRQTPGNRSFSCSFRDSNLTSTTPLHFLRPIQKSSADSIQFYICACVKPNTADDATSGRFGLAFRNILECSRTKFWVEDRPTNQPQANLVKLLAGA